MTSISMLLFASNQSLGLEYYDKFFRPNCQEVDYIDASTPLCPEGASQIPDNYPPAGIVISQNTERPTKETINLVVDILKSGTESKKPPQIFLLGQYELYDKIIAQINELNLTPQQKIKAKNSISFKHFYVPTAPWNQDYIHTRIGPGGGEIDIRYLEGYEQRYLKDNSQKNLASTPLPEFIDIVSMANQCNVRRSENNQTRFKSIFYGMHSVSLDTSGNLSGRYGGNTIGLPSGYCAVGTADFPNTESLNAHVKKVCNGQSLILPTSWLQVGHVDEILTVLPKPIHTVNTNQIPEVECTQHFAIASPREFLKILRKNKKDLFLQFSSELSHNEVLRRLDKSFELRDGICRVTSFNDWPALEECLKLTHENVLEIIEKGTLGKINQHAQEQIDIIKKMVSDNMLQASKSCKVQFLEVPVLFHGMINENNELKNATSILPNIVNLISIPSKLYLPNPQLETIKTAVSKQFSSTGFSFNFIDTFNENIAGGNLHCTTKVFRYCRRPQ